MGKYTLSFSGFSRQKWSGRSICTPVSKIENSFLASSPEAILANIYNCILKILPNPNTNTNCLYLDTVSIVCSSPTTDFDSISAVSWLTMSVT